MRKKTVFSLLVLALVTLAGCERDCDCVRETAVPDNAPAPINVPAPGMKPAPVQLDAPKPVAPSTPHVTGKWTGHWESIGHKGHGGGLSCDAVETGPGKWEATFTAEYGQTSSYKVKLDGKLVDGAVAFGGDVDLGKAGGGVFKWTGKATATEFTGQYDGGGDTGSFKMTRPSTRRGL